MTEYGLTDPLDPLVERFLDGRGQWLLDLVDGRASIAVDETGIEVRGLLLRRRARWSHADAVEVSARLDVVLDELLHLLPVARVLAAVPLLGRAVDRGIDEVVRSVTRGPLAAVRRRLGNVLTGVQRPGADVQLRRQLAALALLRPEVTRHVLREAARRGIPVEDPSVAA